MEQNQTQKNNPQETILLDLSLFILDLLDTQKIQKNAAIRNHILEVPSALVLMLRDSRVGSPVLFLFIYSLLVKTIKKYRDKHINDRRIANLINSPDHTVRGEAWKITQRLFDEFSSLIDIAPKVPLPDDLTKAEHENKRESSDYPIRRYDSIGSFSHEDQKRLQEIYTKELNLPEHPLYDHYFSQIYHAQAFGATVESSLPRKTVSLDDETFKIVSKWKGETKLEEKSNIVKTSREFIKWFTFTYLKDEWQGIVFDKSLDLSVAGVLAGSVTGSLGVSLVTLAGGTLIKAIKVAPVEIIHPDWKPVLVAVISFLIFVCVIILSKPTWFIPKALPTPSSTPPSTLPKELIQQDSPFSTTSVTPVTQVASTEIPTITSTPFSTSSSISNNSPNFCLYVVQPGDTVQSVASWFSISDIDIKNSDNRVNQGTFTLHQLVRINAPCCTHIGVNNGYSYSVQPKDNVLSLTTIFSVSIEKIVSSNNLADSRYIQTGQMLCIPYP